MRKKVGGDDDRKGLWRNGNASDYESEDCRFDPCQARLFLRVNKGMRIAVQILHTLYSHNIFL